MVCGGVCSESPWEVASFVFVPNFVWRIDSGSLYSRASIKLLKPGAWVHGTSSVHKWFFRTVNCRSFVWMFVGVAYRSSAEGLSGAMHVHASCVLDKFSKALISGL